MSAPRLNKSGRNGNRRNSSKRSNNMALISIGTNIFLYAGLEGIHEVKKAPPLFIDRVTSGVTFTCDAGGNIAQAFDLDPVGGTAAVPNWITRYGALFREYRVIKLIASIEALSPTAGKTLVTLDDINNTTPTLNLMNDQGYVVISNSVGSTDSHARLVWRLANFAEAGFVSTATTRTPCYFKAFTDNAHFLTPAAATTNFEISIVYTIQFRGRV